MTVSRSRKPSQSRGGETGPLRAVLFRHVGGIADAVVLSKVWCVLVRFARWLGFSHLLYPIDGAHAHRAVQTRQGNKADSSVGTFVHTIHQPRVAPSTRAPWPPRYERFPPPRCLIWSAWFARSYRWQGKPHGNPTDHYSPVHTISTLPLGIAQLRNDAPNGPSCRCQRLCARYATSHNDPSRVQPGSGISHVNTVPLSGQSEWEWDHFGADTEYPHRPF